MSDSGVSETYVTPPNSPKGKAKQIASCDSNDEDVSTALSPGYVAIALWEWSKEVFQEDAHIMYSQICSKLNISDELAKQIRRQSMPAVPTLKSILKTDALHNEVKQPEVRPRANTFSESSTPAVTRAIEELSVDGDQTLADLAATTAAVRAAAPMPQHVNPRVPADYGTLQPAYMMALMQYADQALPEQGTSPMNVALAQFRPYRAVQTTSHPGFMHHTSAQSMHEYDASILMSAVERGLIPAEKLEPGQCQQVLAAQQRTRRQDMSYDPVSHVDRRSAPRTHHRPANGQGLMRSRPLIDTAQPPPLHQHPAYRQSVQTGSHSPLEQRHTAAQSGVSDRTHTSVDLNAHARNQAGSVRSTVKQPSPANHNSRIGNLDAHTVDSALIPAPLQPRSPPRPERSTYTPQQAESRRVQWVEDHTRAARAKAANSEHEQHHHSLIEEFRAAKAMQHEREMQALAEQKARRSFMRGSTTNLQLFFRQRMRELQSRAVPWSAEMANPPKKT